MARSFIGGLTACILFLMANSQPALAADPAEAELIKVTQAINGELAAFCTANRTFPAEGETAQLAPRAPRHVAAKARDLLVRVQILRRLNGLEEQPVDELPVKDLTAADAKAIADKALAAIRDLRPSFGNPPAAAAAGTGGTATDAYAQLSQAAARLETLDMPSVVPNDVYRAALRVIADLDRIRTLRKLPAIPMEGAEPGLGPTDAYDAAYALAEEVKRLADEHPDFQIPGGVALPERQNSDIRPDTIMVLLSHIGADVSALKVKVGVTQPTKKVAPQAGKTPSDSVAALRAARQMVIAFRNS